MATLTKLLSSFVGQLKPDRAEGAGEVLRLLKPQQHGGMPLMHALSSRRSQRQFAETALNEQTLSDLLWAAYGLNRRESGGRTAPSALNAQEIDIYLALAGGLYIYDPRPHVLRLIDACDARRVTGYQDFVDRAPLDLIYVADHAHLRAIPAQQRAVFSGACAGAIVQNVYLYCASANLATVVRGWFDHNALSDALRLSDQQQVLLTQTVGHPA